MAERILMNEFRALSKEKWVHIELHNENVFEWHIGLMVLNPDSVYHGGYFKARMKFPQNYPYLPPEFAFFRPLYHPNIYRDGRLCISILHPPGDDVMSGESAAERWSPIQRVESVLLSIISLLDDAECSSAANVDAGVALRTNKKEYERRVRHDVEESKKDIPPGFEMPQEYQPSAPVQVDKLDDRDFWYDSDEDDFAGSESDEGMADEDEDDEDEDEDEEEDNDEDASKGTGMVSTS